MGEVYRARDTKLGREVALKLLPEALARDPDRGARFKREAHVLASLNHPNIGAIYGLEEEAGGKLALVLELVPGETLEDRLRRGAIPVNEVIAIAKQIAAALEEAHEKGVVHRDLKPANVKVSEDGKVKVLDFGLAKALLGDQAAESPDLSASPTLTSPTHAGLILGTAAYMAPEQARGKAVDKRADIWAFGVVLFEMLTGKRLFHGETVSDTLAAVLTRDPDWNALPAATPHAVRRVLHLCLVRDLHERLHDVGDARLELEAAGVPTEPAVAAAAKPGGSARLAWVIASFTSVVAAWALWTHSPPSTPQPVRRVTIKLPDTEPLALAKFGPLGIGRTSVALSPDGSLLAYAGELNGKSQLYLRALDRFDAKPIPGTEGAYNPFFSPDGRWLGFFSENKLKKVSLQGGEPVTLCEARIPHGASWGPDDTIVFADSEGVNLSRVSASGGKPEVLLKSGDIIRTYYPEFLPGGKAILFSSRTSSNPDYYNIAVLSLATGERRVLLKGGTNPRYAASGHIVFARAGTILAAPFDLSRLEVTGPAVTLVEGIRIEEWGAAQFALSLEGTLVYVSGAPAWIGTLTWVDQQGISKPLAATAQAYGPVRISPDGQRLAVSVMGATNDVWVYEFARGTFTRLTLEGSNYQPRWTPDGRRIVYRRSGPNQFEIVRKLADGSGAEEVLATSKYPWLPESFSPDGKHLAFTEANPETGSDIWMLPLEGGRQPHPWLKTKFNEWGAAFSPDGKWIAYTSDESGQFEIYVQPYPGPGERWQVSTAGGEEVVWSPDGHTLFHREGLKWMSVAVQTQPEFRAEAPKAMFEGPYLNVPGVSYDVAPDGQRFIMIEENQKQAPTTQLNVVLNWREELKQRVPPRTK